MTTPVDPRAWKETVHSALDEPDPAKLLEKIHLAEEAIFLRSLALDGNRDHREEHSEMAQAGEKLLRLKTEKLGWPPIE